MNILYLWVLLLLPPLYFMYKKHLQEIKEAPLVDDTKVGVRQVQLLYLSLFFIIISLSRPVIENSRVDEKFDAQEFIIAIDASFSMQADDLKPSRYIVAKQGIEKLLKIRPMDRFALFAFTSNALLISPPTTDTAISMMALDALEPKYILTKSTNLKSLFTTIAKSNFVEKKLIVFTDGGDEHNVEMLVNLCKNSNIILYIVATGSDAGASLKQDNRVLRDQYGALVISRINPILEELAKRTGGAYFRLDSSDLSVIDTLARSIETQKSEETNVTVKSYLELYFLPLIMALLLFLVAITNLHQRYFLALTLLMLPYPPLHAHPLDFHYIKTATQAYNKKDYEKAIEAYKRVTPSTKSYFNLGSAYYKLGDYKRAMKYFALIESRDKVLKQHVFYNMGNCAVRLERYDRAKKYYQQALTLGEDADARYNLRLIEKMQLYHKTNVSDMLPQRDAKRKKNSSKKLNSEDDEQEEGSSKGNSNRQSDQSSAGAGSSKKGETKKADQTDNSSNAKSEYKVGYKLYELINKGYTDEQEPW